MAKPIGILGGTFDPVHFGHLRLAIEVCQQLLLQEVRLIPVCSPPHRGPPLATPEQRLQMLQLAVENTPGLTVDNSELQRGGTSYTIDTLKLLREKYDDHSLCLITGMDAFRKLHTWRNWSDLLNYVNIVLVDRPGNGPEFEEKVIQDFYRAYHEEDYSIFCGNNAGSIFKINIPMLDISSTQIRKLIGEGKSVKYLLPDHVITYIEKELLYH